MTKAPVSTDEAPSRTERGRLRKRMKDLLLLLPNLLALMVRLVRDPRVSRADKVILGGTILYVIAPLDFIPDMIPFIGQVDDTYLVAISLIRLFSRADPRVVADHWKNEIDVKHLLDTIVEVSSMFLPKAIRYALTAKIDVNEPRSLRMVRGAKDAKQEAAANT